MSAFLTLFRLIWREEQAAFWRGLALSVTVLVAGATLLGLSGWFITAAGVAGLAGIGIAFDFFRPSAGVRFLALGRTAARYGERVLTHDATLRVLARLRVHLLARLAADNPATGARLRSPALLNRILADVEALDGLVIRLAFPLAAGAATLAFAALVLTWLVSGFVAVLAIGILAAGAGLTMFRLGRQSVEPAAAIEAARQDLRGASMEHLRARTLLAFAGALPRSREKVLAIEAHLRSAEYRLAGLDGKAGAAVSLTGILAGGAALLSGGLLVLDGAITPAAAAIGVFVVLGLIEVLLPLQRAIAEIGRMRDAAARIAPLTGLSPTDNALNASHVSGANGNDHDAALLVRDVTFAAPGSARPLTQPVSLAIAPGETVALTGRSGTGKTTLLSVIAGLAAPLHGTVQIEGVSLSSLGEQDLRTRLGYLPQRSQLVSGTVRDNLRLAAPSASDRDMLDLLDALGMCPALAPRGGLDACLGEGGIGLSGGETRRLALARVLLRRPRILLLDEPTEGLDGETAASALNAVRMHLPDAAILIATHKAADIAACDKETGLMV